MAFSLLGWELFGDKTYTMTAFLEIILFCRTYCTLPSLDG